MVGSIGDIAAECSGASKPHVARIVHGDVGFGGRRRRSLQCGLDVAGGQAPQEARDHQRPGLRQREEPQAGAQVS